MHYLEQRGVIHQNFLPENIQVHRYIHTSHRLHPRLINGFIESLVMRLTSYKYTNTPPHVNSYTKYPPSYQLLHKVKLSSYTNHHINSPIISTPTRSILHYEVKTPNPTLVNLSQLLTRDQWMNVSCWYTIIKHIHAWLLVGIMSYICRY